MTEPLPTDYPKMDNGCGRPFHYIPCLTQRTEKGWILQGENGEDIQSLTQKLLDEKQQFRLIAVFRSEDDESACNSFKPDRAVNWVLDGTHTYRALWKGRKRLIQVCPELIPSYVRSNCTVSGGTRRIGDMCLRDLQKRLRSKCKATQHHTPCVHASTSRSSSCSRPLERRQPTESTIHTNTQAFPEATWISYSGQQKSSMITSLLSCADAATNGWPNSSTCCTKKNSASDSYAGGTQRQESTSL